MSRELPARAVERLLELGTPLAERPELGLVDDDRYELGEILGQGGMGVVYAAFDRELGRRVALKVLTQSAGLSEAARQRFVREAKAAARLVHPHIACVYDASPEAIAMQRVEGATLAAGEVRDPRELAALIRDAALAIHFAHGEGIVHRDLKPANLMVESGVRQHVYVMDFGLAKERAVDSSISLSGNVVGTPAYMAPEQAAGRSDQVGPHTDVYGLGATLYACLAGKAPFADEDVYGLLLRVVEEEPVDLRQLAPHVDADLATIVAKCMAKEPARRYASALALASDLDRWLRDEPIQARPPSLVYKLRRYVSRRQGAIVASLAAAGVAFLLVVPFLVRARQKRVAAEGERELAERVFSLSLRVNDALRDARATRESGVGHERSTFSILEEAIRECRAFLAEKDVAHVWFFQGRLLCEQGQLRDALAAFDRAQELLPGIPRLELDRGLVLAALYRDTVPVLGEDPPEELQTWRGRAAVDLAASLGEEPAVPTAEWLFAAGQLAWVEGDVEGAILKHREVVEMDFTHQEAHLSLTRLYLLTDRETLAMRHSIVATDLIRGNRPSYVAGATVRTSSGEELVPELELLPLEGMRELLVDFNLLLQLDPGDVSTYGLRGQVQARHALRAIGRGERDAARQSLELALREYDAALTLRPDHVEALVNRGVCRAQLARVFALSGEPARAASALKTARADYDAAIEHDPDLSVGWYDRALLGLQRSRLAQLARKPAESRVELGRARRDASEALGTVADEHPWRWRFESLVEELQ